MMDASPYSCDIALLHWSGGCNPDVEDVESGKVL